MYKETLAQIQASIDERKAREEAKSPEAKAFETSVMELAESALQIVYNSDGEWRINYSTSPVGKHGDAIIPINNRQDGELARAQIRGMLTDFALRIEAICRSDGGKENA